MTDTEPFAAPLYECSEPPAGDLLARARRLTAHDASAAGERLLQAAIRELVARVEHLTESDNEWLRAARKAIRDMFDGYWSKNETTGEYDPPENDSHDLYEKCRGRGWSDVPPAMAEILCRQRDEAHAEIVKLKTQLEETELAWTDAKPTVPGLWLYRLSAADVPLQWCVFNVVEVNGQLVHDVSDGEYEPIRDDGQFAGPIPHPADTREGDGK